MSTTTRRFAPDQGTVARLRSRTNEILDPLVDATQPFALLDFPDHDNIGDSAIYAGELSYFHRRNMSPSYTSTVDNFSADLMEKSIGSGPIFLHGGGNFGDVWPWFQPFRENVLKRYEGRPIVQLPQTIFYSSQERLDQTARIIEKHGNFTLLVRDQRSFDLARKSFQCDVRLCPDMAFQIDVRPHPAPTNELLIQLRGDREAAATYAVDTLTVNPKICFSDWPAEHRNFNRQSNFASLPSMVRKLPQILPLALKAGKAGIRPALYEHRAWTRFRRGTEMLARNRYVITDRLHGHIMCVLLDIPHCVIDNSYGKTSSFMEAWGSGNGKGYLAHNVQEAIDTLSTHTDLNIGL